MRVRLATKSRQANLLKFLVVVSQKNQALRMRLFLLESEAGKRVREKIENSCLILFLDWGDSAAALPQELIELAKILGDSPVKRVTLPSATQVFTKLRFRDFKTIYQNLVSTNPKLEKAYLFSYEGHYAVLARTLSDAGVSLTLIEEGLGTYVHSFDNQRIIVPNLVGTLFQAAKGLLGPIVKPAPNTSIPALIKRALREVYWGFFGEPVTNPNEVISGFRDFKTFHSSFPDIAKQLFPHAKVKFTPFGLVMLRAVEAKDTSPKAQILGSRDSIFLGQTYPLSSYVMSEILKKAIEITTGNLWIKPHPRLSPDGRIVLEEAARLASIDRVFFLDNDNSAEYDFYQYRPNLVIGLTSSAMTYASQVHSNCTCITLADLALNLLEKSKNRTDKRTRTVLAADRAVLEFFPHIRTELGKVPT